MILPKTDAKPDGRTESRRRRLLCELKIGKTQNGRMLKPIAILKRAQELLELGEPIERARTPFNPQQSTPELIILVKRVHEAYGFRRETYRFVGIGDNILRAAGVIQ